jgi:hypothetical protein
MNGDLIQCPQNPGNYYLRSVCSEIFRRSESRYWCRTCSHFEKEPQAQEVRDDDTE